MRYHFQDYWPMYVIGFLFLGGLTLAANASIEEQRRVNYCFDRGSVLVQTDAGPRCAPLYSLEKVK